MSISPSEFNLKLSHIEVLAALGIKVGPSLPTKAPCVLCNRELTLYPDIQGGAWFHCPSCLECGDMLELASKTWKLDNLTTLNKLRTHGVSFPDDMLDPRNLERYEISTLAPRIRMLRFLDVSSKRRFQDSEELINLHDQFGLTSYVDPDRWRTQMAKYIGWSDRIEAETAYRPGSLGMGKRGIRGKDRIFQGTYWKGVLAIFFKLAPGRISGNWFVGRKGQFPKDWVYRWSVPHIHEAGLGFYDSVLNQTEQFGNTAFVVQDPALALWLHSKWFKDNGTPLPLALSYEDYKAQTRSVWNYLPPRDWVFWADKPNPAVFAQAASANGRVYIGSVNTPDLAHHVIHLHRIAEKAKSWESVLESELNRLTDQEVESIIYNLPFSRMRWLEIVQSKPEAIRERLEYLSESRYPFKKATITHPARISSRQTVIERDDGWFVDGNLISEAVIRIETSYVVGGEFCHRIRVNYRDKTFTMPILDKTLRNGIIQQIEKECVKRKLGLPWFDSSWESRLHEIAKLFYKARMQDE